MASISFLHLHRAELRGEGGARAPGDDYRREQRRELAAHREPDTVDHEDVGAVALRLDTEQVREHHADEESHQRDDRDGVQAHRLELRHRLLGAKTPRAAQQPERLEHDHADEGAVRPQQPPSLSVAAPTRCTRPRCIERAADGGQVMRSCTRRRSLRCRGSNPRALTVDSVQPTPPGGGTG
jgi:hypothetical protein